MMSSGKRKRDELASQYRGGSGYIPQQDGAGDAMSEDFQVELRLCICMCLLWMTYSSSLSWCP